MRLKEEEASTDRKQLGLHRGVTFQMSQILARTMTCGDKEKIT